MLMVAGIPTSLVGWWLTHIVSLLHINRNSCKIDTIRPTSCWYCEDIKSLTIAREQTEAANQRTTNNAMAKRKMTKWQAMIYKSLHIKQKIKQHGRWTHVLLKGMQFLLHMCTRRATLVTNPVISHKWEKNWFKILGF